MIKKPEHHPAWLEPRAAAVLAEALKLKSQCERALRRRDDPFQRWLLGQAKASVRSLDDLNLRHHGTS